MKRIYLILAVLETAGPYAFLLSLARPLFLYFQEDFPATCLQKSG